MAESSEKSEKASPQRLKKARKEGQFPVAREFVSAIQFYAFVALVAAYFPDYGRLSRFPWRRQSSRPTT
jgi:flagellar biosynthesis protein FlhB